MKRRSALKNLSVAFGGLMSLPAWASGWSAEGIGKVSGLSASDEVLLAEIVETIIPETDTPGAKTLKVDQFAQRMIRDCYGDDVRTLLNTGLRLTDELSNQTYQKGFAALSTEQKKDILVKMSSSNDQTSARFASMIKQLTIQGYTNSEYFMVNKLQFNMAPGFYHGCVPVTQ
jgi:hypothetical protein